MRRTTAAAVLALTIGGLTACSPPPEPDDAVESLRAGLESGTLAEAPSTQRIDLTEMYGDLADSERSVETTWQMDDGDSSTAAISIEWTWDVSGHEWTYSTDATAVLGDDEWTIQWDPAIIHPAARNGSTFEIERLALPERAPIVTEDGDPIVEARPVYHIGIDKTFVTEPDEQREAALELAGSLDFDDPESYADSVDAAGERAFVRAITVRQSDADDWDVDSLREIGGVNVVSDEQHLAPASSFARPILGRVGEATAEIIEESAGRIAAGDVVGVGGLQQMYDERLAGSPGITLNLLIGDDVQPVFTADAVDGEPLGITLGERIQIAAEGALPDGDGVASLVAIRPSTGEILAAATTDAWNAASLARYAPGSTFKVVTALAALRAGYTPDSTVECTETIVVDGRTIGNYPGYSHTGSITLREALAHSCNTAFISLASEISSADLAAAALSLGLGQPGPWAFEYFSGSVPDDAEGTAHAEMLFGQGSVVASPMAMATVAASVAAGETVTPILIPAQEPELDPETIPLTEDEAAALADMMSAVVLDGNSTSLSHIDGLHAKTGTAEVGDAGELQTNAWIIAYRGDLALAVFLEGRSSGIGDAGPVLEAFLSSIE